MTHHDPARYATEEARLFHEGLEWFNDGRFFEAHETWEDLWHTLSGERKRFVQGLIQYAVTLEHVRRGNPRGVRSVFKSALTKFEGLPEHYMGIDVPALLAEFRKTIEPVLDLPASAFDPALPRGQSLPVDLKAAPKIKLLYDPFGDELNRPDDRN